MQKHSLLSLLATCLIASLPGSTFAESNWNDITEALDAAKPAATMTDSRLQALEKLDARLSQPGSERSESCVAYYRAAVDRVLDALTRERVASGARIFQLYSSSVIVQTPDAVFAFDLDQGPNKRLDKTPEEENVPFCMTGEQVKRLASLVEYSFHTHEHDDHIDCQLTRALLDAGQTVIVTASNKEMWRDQPWAEKLTVLQQTYNNPIRLGPLHVRLLHDRQWNNSLHTSGTACDALVVTTAGGVTIMTKGDVNCGLQLYGWLSLLKKRGLEVDAIVGSTVFWRGIDILPEWNDLLLPLWLPGHTWEFTHRKADQARGNCIPYSGIWHSTRRAVGSEKVQVLSWGEWIDVPGRMNSSKRVITP